MYRTYTPHGYIHITVRVFCWDIFPSLMPKVTIVGFLWDPARLKMTPQIDNMGPNTSNKISSLLILGGPGSGIFPESIQIDFWIDFWRLLIDLGVDLDGFVGVLEHLLWNDVCKCISRIYKQDTRFWQDLPMSAKTKQEQPKDRQTCPCKHHFLKRSTNHQCTRLHAERFSSLRTTRHYKHWTIELKWH